MNREQRRRIHTQPSSDLLVTKLGDDILIGIRGGGNVALSSVEALSLAQALLQHSAPEENTESNDKSFETNPPENP